MHVYMSVCVSTHAREREREREKITLIQEAIDTLKFRDNTI